MNGPLAHRRVRMGGRDTAESHRTATPLELLFDLTFVVAFGIAADELAHYLAEDHVRPALVGFAFATFAITWAWINFSWFASAYDTDDWLYRLTTMVQMVGVIVLALGLPRDVQLDRRGRDVDNRVMVAGYVVMRVAMVFQWVRAARQDPPRRAACLTYMTFIGVAQVGWIAAAARRTRRWRSRSSASRCSRCRVRGPVGRRAPQGRDAVARAPHRRALRPAGDHRPRRGDARHDRVAVGASSGRRGRAGRSTPRRSRSPASALTFGMWWIYFVIPCARGAPRRAASARSAGATATSRVIGAVVATGAGPARRGLLPRGALGARRDGDRALRRRPGRDLRRRDLRALRVPDAHVRPASTCGWSSGRPWSSPPRSRSPRPGLPMAWCILVLALRAVGHGGRLRARRAPPQRARDPAAHRGLSFVASSSSRARISCALPVL